MFSAQQAHLRQQAREQRAHSHTHVHSRAHLERPKQKEPRPLPIGIACAGRQRRGAGGPSDSAYEDNARTPQQNKGAPCLDLRFCLYYQSLLAGFFEAARSRRTERAYTSARLSLRQRKGASHLRLRVNIVAPSSFDALRESATVSEPARVAAAPGGV